MGRLKVYLAGGIFGLEDGPAADWRRYARARLAEMGHEAIDPMRRDYRGRERGNESRIVGDDIADITLADAVLAMCLRPSWGTGMELRLAFDIGRPALCVVDNMDTVSPWLRYHATGGLWPSLINACDWMAVMGAPRLCIRCRRILAVAAEVRCMACAEADSDGVDE